MNTAGIVAEIDRRMAELKRQPRPEVTPSRRDELRVLKEWIERGTADEPLARCGAVYDPHGSTGDKCPCVRRQGHEGAHKDAEGGPWTLPRAVHS